MTEHLLVTTDWLAGHLDDPDLRVIDIRGHVLPAGDPKPHYFNHHADYVRSHIPGALFVDWVEEITDPESSHHAQIARPPRYAAVMRRLGIGEKTFVVAYDDANGMFAARLWWSLNYYGHPGVAVLDGGWQKWLAEGRPTTDAVPDIAPVDFTPRPDESWRRTAAQVAASLGTGVQLMDVRSVDEFAGKVSRVDRAGHIPGATNLPRADLLTAEGTLRPPAELRRIFADHGIRVDAPDVVVYCNGGVSASYGLLALKAAGFANGSMYDGSWKEWGDDLSRPIETAGNP